MNTPDVIDFTDLLPNESHRRTLALQNLRVSLEKYGAVFLKNTPVSQKLIYQSSCLMTQLFDLPQEIKLKYSSKINSGRSGYIPFGIESAGALYQPDPKETWHISRDPHTSKELKDFYIDNLWPDELPDFVSFFKKFYTILDPVCELLVNSSLESLGKNQSQANIMQDHNSVLRFTKYIASSNWHEPIELLTHPHSDADLFTIHLYTSHNPCEFLNDNCWVEYKSAPNHILVSVGDMLARISNDKFMAPIHRVKNSLNTNESRYFLGHFVNPHPHTLLECQVDRGEVAKHETVPNLALLEKRARDTNIL